MNKKKILRWLLPVVLLGMAIIQFIPSTPVVAPVEVPLEQREQYRVLAFEGIANFRDIGGYRTVDNRTVKWGKLYRSGNFARASRSDLRAMQNLALSQVIDFRSTAEKEEEPSAFLDSDEFSIVEIPILDGDNNALISEIMERVKTGDFEGFEPNELMLNANRQFASTFTPQFKTFIDTVLEAQGNPLVWHCSAGKDRTGFAAAILLRILGVPQSTVSADYMESKIHALAGQKNQLRLLRLFKGEEAAEKVTVLMGVEQAWLDAAFETIDQHWGSFDNYVANGLQLTHADIEQLKSTLLE